MAFALASRSRGGNRIVARSPAAIRQLRRAPRALFTSLLAGLFLFSTFTAASPIHAWPLAASAEFAEIQNALGAAPEEFLSSFCFHGDGSTSGIPDRDQTQPCKACPFCCGFHHLPLLPQRSLGYPAHRVSAALFPSRVHLTAAREKPAESRPRAQPLV